MLGSSLLLHPAAKPSTADAANITHPARFIVKGAYRVRWNVSRTYASKRSPTLMSS